MIDCPPANVDYLKWVIDKRADVQRVMHHLYKVLDDPILMRVMDEDALSRKIVQLLVGASFSLWRAIFLAEGPRTWLEATSDAKPFLRRVLADNIIGYPDEKNAAKWTVGLYLTNAELRLYLVHELFEKEGEHGLQDIVSRLKQDSGDPVLRATSECELAYEGIKRALSLIAQHLISKLPAASESCEKMLRDLL
jgi:hypothetical protein